LDPENGYVSRRFSDEVRMFEVISIFGGIGGSEIWSQPTNEDMWEASGTDPSSTIGRHIDLDENMILNSAIDEKTSHNDERDLGMGRASGNDPSLVIAQCVDFDEGMILNSATDEKTAHNDERDLGMGRASGNDPS
jgi:hypothetical protein